MSPDEPLHSQLTKEVTMDIALDTTTALVVLLAGLAIRPITAFLTKESADKGPLGIIAGIVLSALTAGGAALADVGDIGKDWKTVVAAVVATGLAAGAAASQIWSGKAVDWIHEKTDDWLGLGKEAA
jgi:hypothetical protein